MLEKAYILASFPSRISLRVSIRSFICSNVSGHLLDGIKPPYARVSKDKIIASNFGKVINHSKRRSISASCFNPPRYFLSGI
ncbi:unknown [Clostridium sp. CAG:813]|nr:unknown [Clostridium sp. CAG:813]